MELCPHCALPVRRKRSICPGCRQPLGTPRAAVTTDGGAIDATDAPAAVLHQPALSGWRDALALRAAKRWQEESQPTATARQAPSRWLIAVVILGLAAAAVAYVARGGGSGNTISASTPVDELPWSVFRPVDRAFAVELPGEPLRLTGSRSAGVSQLRYEVDIPGATLSVSVLSPAGTQSLSQVAAQRVDELGARIATQNETRVAWGNALEVSFREGSRSGWIEVSTNGIATYVVDVRTDDDSARAKALFERLTTSFRPALTG